MPRSYIKILLISRRYSFPYNLKFCKHLMLLFKVLTFILIKNFVNNEQTSYFSIGDWVQLVRDEDAKITGEGTVPVSNVLPLRQKTIHGFISHIKNTYFIVNEEVSKCMSRFLKHCPAKNTINNLFNLLHIKLKLN